MMPGNKIFKLWCKEGMVRAITMMRDGVPTLKTEEPCSNSHAQGTPGKRYSIAIL